jgi:outer membrane receptor protein involved in Fe transport
LPQLQLSASLWTLKLDSELVLDNDTGTTVPAGATRRDGIELSASWRPHEWLIVDADLALTRARFINLGAAGTYIPNAPAQVASLAVEINRASGAFAGAHLRYFGPTPLTQDDAVRSQRSLQVNAEAGYHLSEHLRALVGVFNLLDRRDYDIEYYYASQLRGESTPVNDLHVHPMEPRTVRATLDYRF